MTHYFVVEFDGRDAKAQVEEILLDNNIDFDHVESPIQRANHTKLWAAFDADENLVAEVEFKGYA